MRIEHVDRAGNPWAFELDCTPIQGRMVERLLHYVRSIGSREGLTISYLEDWEANTAFRDGLEHAILSALREWTQTNTGTPDVDALTVSATTDGKTSTANGKVSDTDTEPAETEEREPYYWENF